MDGGCGEVILVVDDEAAVREMACRLLEQCGYCAIGAESGEVALRVFRKRSDIAAVLTDLAMPGMSGVELAREVRVIRPGIPMIAISGEEHRKFDDDLADLGVTEVVEKPFHGGRLLQAIETVLRKNPS